ncbi:MAG: HNH endonuclease [Candidatus Bathyarchaeum sp.]|nr:MAG: HNH endonuclease [Candidatus Bathyarchaeum sp.]
MAPITPDNDFKREVICTYKKEEYSVRDNGAVLRHPRENGRVRPTDNQWTFGKPNKRTGYMEIASERVHRIVAMGFLGQPPTKKHVVDHVDTNKQNNRPDNLRWFTRLENVLLNPITVKRIEFACGCSVEEFLANPSKYRDKFQEPNYKWMCTVSEQEAKSSLERLLNWAKSDKTPSGGSLGEWIFNRNNTIRKQTEKERIIEEQKYHPEFDEMVDEVFQRVEKKTGVDRKSLSSKSKKAEYHKARIYAAKLLRSEMNLSDECIGRLIGRSKSMVNAYLNRTDFDREKKVDHSSFISHTQTNNSGFGEPDVAVLTESLTPNAVQRKWKTPSEFPCCPQECTEEPIRTYANNLITGSVFCRNNLYSSLVFKSSTSEDKQAIYVITESAGDENSVKPLALARITFENGKFLHTSLGSFFTQEGAEKQFCLAQGLEWHGGDSIDDYC